MTAAPQPERPVFILTLKAEPHCVDTDRMLRRALKVLLRRFGLRCVSVEEASS
jgi:hypothetical protein